MGLDVVEIVMGWEKALGICISDDEAFALRTPRMAIDLFAQKLGVEDEPRSICLTLRAFHRLRASVESVTMVERRDFRPGARLKELASRKQWDAIRAVSEIESLPKPGAWGSPRTVGELTRWVVIYASGNLKRMGEPWTRSEIRSVVRGVVADVTGLDEFADDDDFIKDMRID